MQGNIVRTIKKTPLVQIILCKARNCYKVSLTSVVTDQEPKCCQTSHEKKTANHAEQGEQSTPGPTDLMIQHLSQDFPENLLPLQSHSYIRDDLSIDSTCESQELESFTDEQDHNTCTHQQRNVLDYGVEDGTEEDKYSEIDEEFTKLGYNFSECTYDNDIFYLVLTNNLGNKKGDQEPNGSLKERGADTFSTIFECLQTCGGMDMQLFRRILADSNSHANEVTSKGKYFNHK